MVPTQFFGDFSDEVYELIQLEDDTEGLLDSLDLKRFKNDFKYTEEIDLEYGNVKSKIIQLKPIKTSKSRRLWWWTGAVAAGLAVIFSLTVFNTKQPEVADNLTSEEVLLAYLDEEDLVDYILENKTEIETDSTAMLTEYFYEELEDEIYNYLNDI